MRRRAAKRAEQQYLTSRRQAAENAALGYLLQSARIEHPGWLAEVSAAARGLSFAYVLREWAGATAAEATLDGP